MAGRSRRHVASEGSQRRDDLSVDRDRCVFETGVVHSAEEQVGGFAGGRLQTVAKRRQQQQRHTDYIANRKGSEFLNRSLQRLLKEYGVHHFATYNEETRANIAERFNRSPKTRMWRYFTKTQMIRYVDALQDFVHSYNSYHRSIGMAPSAVNGANQETVWQRLYGHDGGGVPKYRVGDRVRISKAKRHFEKGYMANWTEELFTIVDAHRSDPPVYRLVHWHGDRLDGTFYEPELQKVIVSADKTCRGRAAPT